MKNSSSHIIISQAQIDRSISVEIVWDVGEATVTIVVIRHFLKIRFVTKEIGPFGTFGEMSHELLRRFDAFDVHRLCHPNRLRNAA